MVKTVKEFTICLVTVFVIFSAIGFVLGGSNFILYKTFAPAFESVRRETLEESKAYNQGVIQEVRRMHDEYIKEKDPSTKSALTDSILHRTADYDTDKLPKDLKVFVDQLRRGER